MSETVLPQRRLRIAILNRVFSAQGGGAESYSIRLAEQLASRHEVHVFAQDIAHEWPGVTYHRVSCPTRKPRWVNQLWYALATWRATHVGFDVVHSHENTWHGNVQTLHVQPVRHNLVAGRSGWRLALRWLKIGLSPRLLSNLLLEAARFRAVPGRQLVATSPTLAAVVLQAYPHAAGRLAIVTPGVNLPGPGLSRSDARRQLGLPQSAALVLFVANDYRRKGLDTLLHALQRMPDGTMLAVVGNPAGIAVYRERAASLGLAERVYFLGAMTDMAPAYRAATVLAHPTLDDTFAMVVLEAMAHGLPVVVSSAAHCGISALLTDGEQALLLDDPLDARRLAGALERVLAEPALANHLSEQGLLFAGQHSWQAAALDCEQIYLAGLRPPA